MSGLFFQNPIPRWMGDPRSTKNSGLAIAGGAIWIHMANAFQITSYFLSAPNSSPLIPKRSGSGGFSPIFILTCSPEISAFTFCENIFFQYLASFSTKCQHIIYHSNRNHLSNLMPQSKLTKRNIIKNYLIFNFIVNLKSSIFHNLNFHISNHLNRLKISTCVTRIFIKQVAKANC